MPILGKIKGFHIDSCLKNMLVGSSGYIDEDEIIVTQKAVFISLFAEIFDKEESEEEDIIVRRIGPGLTEEDFEIDFQKSTYQFRIDSHAVYVNTSRIEGEHIMFTRFELEAETWTTYDHLPQKTTLEMLEEKLEQAKTDEDFEGAAKLREEIKKEKAKIDKK